MIKVAFTIEQCWHKVPGGTAVAALGMARALLEHADVDLIGVAARHRRPPPAPWAPPIEVAHLPLPRLALYESWHRLRAPKVETATGRVDAIHATSNAVPPRSAPLIVTVHDLIFLRYPEAFTRHGLSFFRRGLQRARDDADIVTCPSQATLDDCIAAGFDKDRLRLIPMGVDAHPVAPIDIERVRLAYGLNNPYILWVGTIEPRKNLRALLSAYRQLDRDLDLVLVGPRGWNEDVGALVDARDDRMKVIGFAPRPDLDALYAGADVFCFPSFAEGFGLPVLEAMAQATPVVTSKGTSTEEVAGDAALLVDPLDPSSVAAALDRVLADPGLAAELGERGKRRAAQYSWTRTGDLLAAVYAEVASGRRTAEGHAR